MSSSIFKDDLAKPGIYKIQNVVSEGFVDIDPNTKIFTCKTSNSGEVCPYPYSTCDLVIDCHCD